jgi:hypothetical protein
MTSGGLRLHGDRSSQDLTQAFESCASEREDLGEVGDLPEAVEDHPVASICLPISRPLCSRQVLSRRMLDRRGVSRRHTFLVIRAIKGPRRESFELMYWALESDVSRDFVSDTSIVADRYEVHADEGVADRAKRVLSTMPGRS